MFPPEIDREQLRKCIRLVPQDQNSGGFFIAVFQTTADVLSRRDGTTEDAKSVGEGDCSSEQTKDKLWGGAKLIANDPLIALSQKDDSATVRTLAAQKQKRVFPHPNTNCLGKNVEQTQR